MKEDNHGRNISRRIISSAGEGYPFVISLTVQVLMVWFDLVLMIFNEGACLTLNSIFHKALNLFQFVCKITSECVPGTNQY